MTGAAPDDDATSRHRTAAPHDHIRSASPLPPQPPGPPQLPQPTPAGTSPTTTTTSPARTATTATPAHPDHHSRHVTGTMDTVGPEVLRQEVRRSTDHAGTSRAAPEQRSSGTKPTLGRWRSSVRRALIVLAVIVAMFAAAAGGLLAAVPGVGNAPALVRAEVASHGGQLVTSAPAKVGDALIAIEDQAFRSPPGVDIAYGAGRYLYARLLGRTGQGGATLAQQLAKRLYTGPSRNPLTIVEQVGLAFKLELDYSHEQILTMYLNDVYFGDGAYGIVQASQRYFHRSPTSLDWAQASVLAGLVQAPSALDPLVHPRRALLRRNAVIAQLQAMGVLSPSAARRVAAQPLL